MKGTHATAYEQRESGWYVLGFRCGELGPFETRQEAVEEARVVRRHYQETWGEWQRKLMDDVDWKPGQLGLF